MLSVILLHNSSGLQAAQGSAMQGRARGARACLRPLLGDEVVAEGVNEAFEVNVYPRLPLTVMSKARMGTNATIHRR